MSTDHDEDHGALLHKAMNRASWLQQPLEFPVIKKKIKDAQDDIIKSAKDNGGKPDPKVKENSAKVIHGCEHEMFEECSKLIAQKEMHLGEDAAAAIRTLAERLGGAGPSLTEADRPETVTGPIPHDDDDHNHPGTIQLARVFNWLLFKSITLLKELNNGIKEERDTENADRLVKAQKAFSEFMYELDGFRPAILTFNIVPVKNDEGYYVSAVAEAHYINTSHSSSTVRIAP